MINKMGEYYPIYHKLSEDFQGEYLIGEMLLYLKKGVNYQDYGNRVIICQYSRVINFILNIVNYQKYYLEKGKGDLP